MRDSTPLLGNLAWESLREEYHREGYLHIKGLIDRSTVLQARECVVKRLQKLGRLAEGHPKMDAIRFGKYGIGDIT